VTLRFPNKKNLGLFLTYISKNELRIPFLKGITPSWDDAQVRYCQSKKLVALFAQ
jgi:hypothetical protein